VHNLRNLWIYLQQGLKPKNALKFFFVLSYAMVYGKIWISRELKKLNLMPIFPNNGI